MKALELGLVARPHGVRGELKLGLHFEQSTTLFEVPKVVLVREGTPPREYEIDKVRRAGKAILVMLAGVDSREAAEQLRGARVLVDRDALPALAPGEYYLADLVGCTVRAPGGELGVVEQVVSHPSVDSLLIRTPEGRRIEQPILDEWIERVSVEDRLVVLSSEDGLID